MSIPQAYLCPITLSVMIEPYSDNDGNSYEKDAIFKWISERGISPITRNPMMIGDLRPNRALKDAIDEFMNQNKTKHAQPAEQSESPDSIDTSAGREPVNIIMIADTSGSMQETCDLAGAVEKYNMTRLDLVKHTMKTVVESLAPTDNLALISFSYQATILSNLGSVNKITKVGLNDKINNLNADGGTNIWDALKVAVDMATNYSHNFPEQKINIMLFTDGESNNDPPRGIVPTLNDYLSMHMHMNITLNTYGFGNNINSKLLYDISQLKNGIFGFIPDATMIGTLFINSIAYMMDNKTIYMSQMEQYYIDKFIEFISNNKLSEFQYIISNDMDNISSGFLRDLHSDCAYFDNDNDGQINKALSPLYYQKWGKHYILSVLSAYKNKMCLNFKDKGVQYFKTPEFETYQKKIEEIFINLPPPIPSGGYYGASAAISSQQFSQTFYNASATTCILENTLVRVFEDNREQYIPVQDIKKGTCILSGETSTFVRCVIKTKHNGTICINNNDTNNPIGITPYHPINITDYNDEWMFPIDNESFEKVNIENVYVYNFFLEDKHEIELRGGIRAITLNHGMSGPVISHEYFGTNRVENDFHSHPDWDTGYICIENIKAIRDKNTNQVIKLEY
jgi:Mg-chelatase subunit ChlD